MLEKKTALGGGAKIAVTSHWETILAGLETKISLSVQSPRHFSVADEREVSSPVTFIEIIYLFHNNNYCKFDSACSH